MNEISIKDTTANPAPLGLLGFSLTTILLNIHNAGFFPLDAMILAMGLFFGGITQMIAGVMEWKKNNTFGTTAFTAYGAFWLTLVGLIILPKLGLAQPATDVSLSLYLAVWGLFTFFMFLGTLNKDFVLKFIFGSLTLLFFMLAVGNFADLLWLKTLAGYEGIVCGTAAFYSAVAQILNETYGKTLLPLG